MRERMSVTSQVLAAIPLFSHMDEEEHRELHALMTERSFRSGQTLMRAGEPGGAFQIIQQGEVEPNPSLNSCFSFGSICR